MKNLLLVLTSVVLAAPLTIFLSGCGVSKKVVGSGNVLTDTLAIEDFVKVEARHRFKVTLVPGAAFKVAIRADDNMMPELIVKKSGDTLVLDLKESNYNLKNVTLDAEVTMPVLNGITLSGVTKAKVTGFKSDEPLNVRLSGATTLSGEIESGPVEVKVSGASSVKFTGKGGKLIAQASGASKIEMASFSAGSAEASASGASHISLQTSGMLDADASGASTVSYSGDPTLGKIETTGASKVERR